MKENLIGFHELYQNYASEVYRFAFWLSGDSDCADDIVSETFTRVWLSKAPVRLNTVRAYLFTIARNLYLQGQRRKRRQDELPADLVDSTPSPAKQLEESATTNQVLRWLRELPEIDRTVLVLHAFEKMPQLEIATVLNLSLSAVKVKIYRSRKKMLKWKLSTEEM